jgi:hypothetical protein
VSERQADSDRWAARAREALDRLNETLHAKLEALAADDDEDEDDGGPGPEDFLADEEDS